MCNQNFELTIRGVWLPFSSIHSAYEFIAKNVMQDDRFTLVMKYEDDKETEIASKAAYLAPIFANRTLEDLFYNVVSEVE